MTAVSIAPGANSIRVSVNPDRGAPRFAADAVRPWAQHEQPDNRGAATRQGTLTLVLNADDSDKSAARRRRRAAAKDEEQFGPVRTATIDLPDARHWAGHLGMSLMQVSVGARPAPQVMRHVSPLVYDSVLRRHSRAMRRGTAIRRPMRVRRVVLGHPHDSVVEAAVIIDDGGRIRPIAMRLDGQDGRWLVTALEMG